jgi:hypothetical protein
MKTSRYIKDFRSIPSMAKATRYIANFDSATAMLRATGRYLRGKDFPQLGMMPGGAVHLMSPVAGLVNAMPRKVRERIYIRSGWGEAIPPRKLGKVRAEEISRWVVGQYPRRRYPAVMIGSSNGAAVHLCSALGIPWLPQTSLIPVRHPGIHPDEPREGMEWGKEHAPALLDANPDLQLHHMHDANQDRLMIQRMTYFRVKRLRLGETYERFLEDTLAEGGTIFLLECQLRWPTTRVDERHVFQHGAPGGATPEEYLRGSARVEKYLERYSSHRRRWDPPEPDGESPEAEWGFERALGEDVERFARDRGYRVRRILFEEPEELSPLVADLYRWWYKERRLLANRLLAESFILMEPYWALRTGSVPFWSKFAMESPFAFLERYLDGADPYEEIHMMLFSHGVDSVGLVPIERWRSILGRARKRGAFVGVDERKFPRDFATFIRYYTEVKKIPSRYPLPGPLALSQLDAFLQQAGDRYPVRWT